MAKRTVRPVSIEIRYANGELVKVSQGECKLTDEQQAALADATAAVLRFAGAKPAAEVTP